MARFPSLKAKKLIRVLEAQPLGYRIARPEGLASQAGSA
jgi:predicted RNA binding protein YcfA (HicA-like mRNA interferase family)